MRSRRGKPHIIRTMRGYANKRPLRKRSYRSTKGKTKGKAFNYGRGYAKAGKLQSLSRLRVNYKRHAALSFLKLIELCPQSSS